MAGIEKIKEKILLDAQAQVQATLDGAKKNADATLLRAQATAEAKAQDIRRRAERDAAEKKRTMISMNALEMKKEVLQTKQEVIVSVFEKALTKLTDLEMQNPKEFIKNLILSASETGDEELLLSKALVKMCDDTFIAEVNEALKAAGKKGALKVNKDAAAEVKSGFVLRNGGVELNGSFESVMKSYRDEIEPAVAALLFE